MILSWGLAKNPLKSRGQWQKVKSSFEAFVPFHDKFLICENLQSYFFLSWFLSFPKVAHHSLKYFYVLYASLFLCLLDLFLGNGQLCPFYARYLFLWPRSHFCKLRKVFFWKYYSAILFILAMLCWKCDWHDWWLDFDPVDIWRKNIPSIKSCYPIFC